jgi:RimJ/RimL family protein N-acetyltransferase
MVDLTDGVVYLRPMTADDVHAHLAGEDEVTARFVSGGRSTTRTVAAWIERNRESWATGGPIRSFGVCEAATDRLVGMVDANLDPAGVRRGVANITYGIHPDVRRRGHATRAIELMLRYLVDATDTDIAMIQAEPTNEASLRVAMRAGFRRVGAKVTEPGSASITFVRRLREGQHP